MEDNNLVAPVTPEEIRNAFFNIKGSKALTRMVLMLSFITNFGGLLGSPRVNTFRIILRIMKSLKMLIKLTLF